MKKILIVSDSLRIGGIQSSLKTFIKMLSTREYDITLFLFNDTDKALLENSNIKIISGSRILKTISYTASEAKQKGSVTFLIRKALALLCKIFSSNVIYKCIFFFEKRLSGYDIAISYSNNISDRSVYFGYNKFVLEKVDAKFKIGYIHADYDTIHFKVSDREYKKFDQIWFVSNYVKNSFLKYNNECKNKCKVIYNFIDEERLNKIGNNPFEKNIFNIVTIGRLDKNKSQIDAIDISMILKENNLNFKWYLLGEGPERKNIEIEIKKNNLQDNIILLGNVSDISKYLVNSSVFVSLSKSESYGLAIAEALYLNTVTIVKYIPVAKEIITDNGIICKDNKEIANQIIKLNKEQDYYNRLKKKSILHYDEESNLDYICKVLENK